MVKHFSKVAEYLLSAEKIWIVDKTVTNKCPVIKEEISKKAEEATKKKKNIT
jgi:hypothetical protein